MMIHGAFLHIYLMSPLRGLGRRICFYLKLVLFVQLFSIYDNNSTAAASVQEWDFHWGAAKFAVEKQCPFAYSFPKINLNKSLSIGHIVEGNREIIYIIESSDPLTAPIL